MNVSILEPGLCANSEVLRNMAYLPLLSGDLVGILLKFGVM